MINFADAKMYLKYFGKNIYLKYLKAFKKLDYEGRIESGSEVYRGYEGCYPVSKILKKLKITKKDSVIDIGCGKGLFLYYASKYPFSKITGIDYSSELIDIAKENAKKLKEPRIDLMCCDARRFEKYGDYNIFFINNPFDRSIMGEVIELIKETRKTTQHEITVIYQFPFNKDLFIDNGFRLVYDVFPNCILRL